VVPQVFAGVTTQMSCGSGALSATVVHVPAVAVRLQAMHASVHRLSQHTPWAQKPETQSAPTLQFAPRGLRPQDEFWQKFPVTHCLSLTQMS
jgi:hypothetical protein